MTRKITRKEGPNQGREFWSCPKPMGESCQGAFRWCDERPSPICKCKQPKVRRITKKEGPNQGREFFVCPRPYGKACNNEFQWCDEVEAARLKDNKEEDNQEEPKTDWRSLVPVNCDILNERRPVIWQEGRIPSFDEILRFPLEREVGVPSVSKILQATMSEESKAVLARWEAMKIRELGLAGFQQLKADTFSRGHTLHRVVETYLETGDMPRMAEIEDPVSKRHVVSFSSVMRQFCSPIALESAVKHDDLRYCGIIDCVARIEDKLFLIDWKTSEKEKSRVRDLYDNPLQVAAYLGAINADDRYSDLGGNISQAAVVVIYNSGLPAVTHTFDTEQMKVYWDKWLERLEQYHKISH